MERYIHENLTSKYFSLMLFIELMYIRHQTTSVTNVFRMSRLDPAWETEISEGQVRSYMHYLYHEKKLLDRDFDFDVSSKNPRNRSAYTYCLSKDGREIVKDYLRRLNDGNLQQKEL